MIVEAEKRGEIKPGDVLIEATSGNTGIALAMIAALKGYQMKLLMPDNMSQERRAAMRAYGAELILVTKEQGMEGARDLALAMAQRGEGKLLDQFNNPDNPYAHYTTTGPEIWRQTDGRITHFVSSMGTTGTITGVSRFLREQDKAVSIVGLQRKRGAVFPAFAAGLPNICRAFFNAQLVDVVLDIHQQDARKHHADAGGEGRDFLRRQFRRRGGGRVARCPRKSRRGSGGDRLRSRRSLPFYRCIWRRAFYPGRGNLNLGRVEQVGTVGVIHGAEPAFALLTKDIGCAPRDLCYPGFRRDISRVSIITSALPPPSMISIFPCVTTSRC
ncbi:cysteine synthase B [Klebsiella grimontii]|uniref:Cysteine synthase B n=1 Tax=Klebsiella grimontii TaxID=2058152 RepID=A0A7H4NZ99_9ENTR|nr:cysteine synthase B [Klebsiella grimontii]